MINNTDNLIDVDDTDADPYDYYDDEDYVQSKPNKMKSPKFREHKDQ